MRGFRSVISVFKTGFQDTEFRALLYLSIFVLIAGSLFYYYFEPWSFVDSMFFAVVTLTTVGYGDPFIPSTTLTKVFTMGYILLGVGLILAFITKVAQIVERGVRD